MEQAAFEMGMEFREKDEWGLINLLKAFKLFREGHSGRITNMMKRVDGMLEMDCRIFDYRYVRGYGKYRRVRKQTVFFMHSKELGLPEFFMKPETFFHKVGEWLGMEDIDFVEFPEFSDQYRLKGDNEDFIRHTMNEKVLHFFTVEKDWNLEGVNYYLIFYRKSHLMPPGRIRLFYHKGLEIVKLLSASN